jgi:hypothetical protein
MKRVKSPGQYFASLGLHFLILLDMEVFVALEDADVLFWEFDTD